MLAELARNWWILAIRGVAAILFGIGAFLWPEITITVLVLLFGAYALVDGIFAVIAGISVRKEQERWWMMVLEGLAGIVIGVITFLYPGITQLVLLYFIAYLDRNNVGFAKLTMSEDIGLSAAAYGLGAGMFFIGYALLEIPSNAGMYRFGARKWIARILIACLWSHRRRRD